MRTIKRAAVTIAAALFVFSAIGLLAATAAAQDGPVVDVHDVEALPGEEGTTIVGVHNIAAPGLAAWTLDISYDPDVITVDRCLGEQGGICNINFGPNTIRFAGGRATGLEGEHALGGITFVCGDEPGTSPLTLTPFTFADGTLGDPQPIDVTVVSATFTCLENTVIVEEPPDAGIGIADTGSSRGWGIDLLVVVGVAALIYSSTLFARRTI